MMRFTAPLTMVRIVGGTRARLAAASIALLFAAGAHAQPGPAPGMGHGTPPVGLNWQWMHEVVFDSNVFPSTGTAEEKSLLSSLWAKELQGATVSGTRYPSFVLVSSAAHDGFTYVFSIYDRAFSGCEPAPNGSAGADQMYSKCPLRVNKIGADGQGVSRDFPGYCMMSGDSKDNPREKNHTEFAFDARNATAYFRVIQFGKLVASCNRSIRLVGS